MSKHTPYTNEPSAPHTGKLGTEHVNVYHYGEGGCKEGETKHQTDEGHIEWGRDAQKLRVQKKKASLA